MIEGFPYEEYPTGWFQVLWSAQVEDGQILPLEYFDRKLVCYRGSSGAAQVMDAHCRHMGAHLAFGGTVEGDDIRCPFHGWAWGPDGHNTDIPYSSRKTLNVSMRTYPTLEQDGLVLMWFSPSGEPPSWEPPAFLPVDSDQQFFDLFPLCTHADQLRMQPQMMSENAVDSAHLVWTHRWTGKPELINFESNGHRFVADARGLVPTAKGVVNMSFTTTLYGLGLIVSPMRGIRDVVNVAAATPIDHDYSNVFISTFVSCPDGGDPAAPDSVALAIARAQIREVIGGGEIGDRKIWENQRYVEHAPLVPEEAPGMRAIRSWAAEFYRTSV